jgi:hypothetical protein
MLDSERCTLTHSLGAAVALALLLALALGLVVSKESTVAAGLPVVVDVPVGEGSADGDVEVSRDGDGEAVFSGVALELAAEGCAVADPVGESVDVVDWLGDGLAEWLADGLAEGECDGDGDGEWDGDDDGEDDGDDVGVEVADEGSAWHTVSVFDVAAAAVCAVPSTPRVRKLPLSKVTAAALTCAKRMRIACLRCSSALPSSLW